MSNVFDQRNNSKDDLRRIEHLEAELEHVENAFEEYIATTECLEVDLKRALCEMQKKINHSTSANEKLLEKLRNSESIIQTLRLSSERVREKLKSETKLRREAEKALTERELEIRIKTAKIKQLERNDSSMLRNVDSGIITEMVNNTSKGFTHRELEAVTDELMITQERLQTTEQKLQRSQRLIDDLERNLENIGKETAENMARADKEILRELDEIRAEIGAGRGDIESQLNGCGISKVHSFKRELQLEEFREERSRLINEISCLRNTLYDHGEARIIEGIRVPAERETISVMPIQKTINEVKEEQHSEIESLRKQIEEVLNENMNLQERLRTFEISSSLVTISTDEKSRLENEVQKLKDELHLAYRKVEKPQQEERIKFDSREKIEAVEDGIIGFKFATDVTPYGAELGIDAKLRQSQRMLEESQQECSRMRSEILSITEALYHANQSLRVVDVSNEELKARDEAEDKKNEIPSFPDNLMRSQEEFRLLSEEISYMSNAFEKAQDDELQKTESALAAAEDTKFSQESEKKRLELLVEKTPQRNADIFLFRSQFQKLSEKNEQLARQIKNVETEILSVREKQENVREDTHFRVRLVKELQENVDEVVNKTHQKNHEVEELALMIENRIRAAEENVGTLRSEIAIAMKNFQTDELASSNEKSKKLESINQDDPSKVDIIPVKIGGLIDKGMKSEIDQFELLPLPHSRRLGEILNTSTTVAKSGRSDHEFQLNEDDRTTVTTSLEKDKYQQIIQRVAQYQSLSLHTKEDRELETTGDIDVEEREQ